MVRIVIAAVAALFLSAALLQDTGQGRGAVRAVQGSVQVAVVPGFQPKAYSGTFGVPRLPVTDSQLSSYHFSEVAVGQVTSANLANYDTVLLYGIRWSDLSSSAQAAINTFARTGKVLIWDSDDTGAQNYASFIHPFATDASGENGKANDSVVSFPGGDNFLASPDPSSPAYLDPNRLVSDRNMINDMNAMKTGTSGWTPALVAGNKNIPQGGWVVAWSYGVVADHTGLEVYSGIDADAFTSTVSPNYSVKELAIELAAPFKRAPDSSCAPNCQPPPTTGGKPFASCAFGKRLPRGWVHGRFPIFLKTSIAAGITGQITTGSGKALVSGRENAAGQIRLLLRTTRLPSNRSARLRAVVLVNGQQACSKSFRLRVDNVRPKLLTLATTRHGSQDWTSLRVSEKSWVTMAGHGVKWPHPTILSAHRLFILRLPARVHAATMVVRDRANNRLVRHLRWH
ncbi:MAG TPA: hypothetical protein VJ838_00350 [Gaiellaceae bacterium]|nr:hypothetical protein [Gaiellaceae bacterium]